MSTERTAKQKAATKRMIAANKAARKEGTVSKPKKRASAKGGGIEQQISGARYSALSERIGACEKDLKKQKVVLVAVAKAVISHDITLSKFASALQIPFTSSLGPSKAAAQLPAANIPSWSVGAR